MAALSDSIGRKKVYHIPWCSHDQRVVLLFAHGSAAVPSASFFLERPVRRPQAPWTPWFVDEFTARNPHADLQRALATANLFHTSGHRCGSLLGGIVPMLAADLPEAVEGASIYSRTSR